MNKVILADNQSIFRTGMAKILAMEDDFHIVAQCLDAGRLKSTLATSSKATVLFGSTLTSSVGPLLQQLGRQQSRGIAILEITEQPASYLAAGIHGLVYRNVTGQFLVDCIRRVNRGERVMQSSSQEVVAPQQEDLVGARVRDRMTPKEMRIIALLVQGMKNKEIASQLNTTEQVIKNYLRAVYDKTGVSDRLELALFTIHHRAMAEAAAAVGKRLSEIKQLDEQLTAPR